MKATLTFSLLIAGAFASAQTWTPESPLPAVPRDGSISFVIGDHVFVGGGLGGHKDLYEYDPASGDWTSRGLIPGVISERAFSCAFVINDIAYICAGSDGTTFLRDLWAYDPVTHSWTPRADYPSTVRNAAFAFALNGKGYVCGGTNNSFIYSDFMEYDPGSNSWTPLGALPMGPTIFGSSFVIGDHAYVMGGDHGTSESNDVYRYNAEENVWDPMQDSPVVVRQAAVGFTLNGKGYFGLGQTQYQTALDDLYSYDSNTDTWTPEGSFPGGVRCWAVGAGTGENAYIGTGWNFGSTFYNDWWTLGSLTSTPELHASANSLHAFPVPVTDQLHLRTDDRATGMLAIYDIRGCEVIGARPFFGSADPLLGSLMSGMYEAVLTLKDGTSRRVRFVRD